MRYRHLRRTVIAVLAAVAFVLVLGLLATRALDSELARRTAAHWIEAAAGRADVELRVASLRWGWIPLRLQLGGVTVQTAGVRASIESAVVELAQIRIARRSLDLGTVAAHGIRVHLEGVPRAARERRRPSQLRVTVRHLDLHDVAFEGRQLPGKIAIDLEGITAAWATEEHTPRGYLTVDSARLRARGIEPIEVEIRARIEAEDGLRFPMWRLEGDGVRLVGQGRIPLGDGVRMTANGTVDLAVLDRLVRARGRLRGTVQVTSRFDTSRSDLLRVDVAAGQVEAAGFPFDRLRGSLSVERDSVSGVLEQAEFHGGRVSGRYRLSHLKGPTRPHTVELHGSGVRLAGLLRDLGVPDAGLAATMTTDAELAWDGRDIEHARGRAEILLKPTPHGLGAQGRVSCEVTPQGLLLFSGQDLKLGGSTLRWQGPLTIGSWEPAWSINSSPAVLEEVIPLVNAWTGSQVLPSWISGVANLQVSLSGPWRQLVVGVRLDAHPLLLPPIELDRVIAEATIRGSELRLGTTRFSIGDGHGEAEGTVAWGPASGQEQLDLALRGFRLPLDRVAAWLGASGAADGAFSFTGGLRGPIAQPRGSWAVGVDDATLAGQPLGGGSASVDLAQARFEGHGVRFDSGLEGHVWWDVASGEVGGELSWPAVPTAPLGAAVERLVGDRADLRLDFRLPRDGYPTGRIEALCPNAQLTAEADDDGSVQLTASIAGAITGEAVLVRSDSRGLAGGGELRVDSVQRLVQHLLPDANLPLEGRAAAVLEIEWPNGGLPAAIGRLDELQLALEGRPVELLAPAPFTVSEDGLAVQGLHVGVAGDDLFARWSIAPGGTLGGNVSGTLDALLLRFLLPGWEPAGRATGVVELLGTVDRPLFEGLAELDNVSFRIPQTRTILSGVDGTLLLSSDEVLLEGIDFRLMQGAARAGGRIAVRDDTVVLALNGSASSLRYEIFPGLIASLSGAWRLEGPVENLDLTGDITVDRAVLRRKDDVATILLDWFGTPSPPSVSQGPHLDLHVEADESIEVRNPFVRLVGSASLDISGTASQPGILGKVEFEEGGEITLQTVRYDLERGSLTFSDPSTVAPFIELQATTWVQNYQITVRVAGTPDRLMPSVASNPPLSEGEIYSLLALGYRDQDLGSGAMGVGLASTLLTREITSEIDRRARNLLPVDQVRVDPFAETSTGNPTARISLVKQLNPTWTFIVQSNLSAEREEVVVSRWYLAPGLFVEASRDIDGSYGVDLKLRRPY